MSQGNYVVGPYAIDLVRDALLAWHGRMVSAFVPVGDSPGLRVDGGAPALSVGELTYESPPGGENGAEVDASIDALAVYPDDRAEVRWVEDLEAVAGRGLGVRVAGVLLHLRETAVRGVHDL